MVGMKGLFVRYKGTKWSGYDTIMVIRRTPTHTHMSCRCTILSLSLSHTHTHTHGTIPSLIHSLAEYTMQSTEKSTAETAWTVVFQTFDAASSGTWSIQPRGSCTSWSRTKSQRLECAWWRQPCWTAAQWATGRTHRLALPHRATRPNERGGNCVDVWESSWSDPNRGGS